MRPAEAMNRVSRDPWASTCTMAAFVALVLIAAHVTCPPVLGLEMPYAGGGAVVLGIGAVLCSTIRSRTNRLLATSALLGLMVLRFVATLRPDLFIASHGDVSLLDGAAMLLLIVVAAIVVVVAAGRRSSRPDKPMAPIGSAGG